jgi:hypothetical protein
MTTYKNIKGKRIKTFATDLDNEQAEGQIFYQDTANEFKTVVSSAAWSAGANGITARPAVGGFGIQTSAVMFGGGPASKSSLTEEYNGTGFTTSGTLNTGRPTCQDNGWGVETAGVVASGNTPGGNTVNVEEYNGSSWSEVNNVSVARRQQASIGLVQTAGAICGGFVSANTDATEEYDGTNWTNGGNLNTTRRGFVGAGTLTAGIVYSGYTTEIVTNTEEYNGTAWTNATSINTARNNGAGSTNAPQSTALLFGGNTGSDTGNTEQYNGTTWTEVADMAVARDGLGGGGIGSTALAAFGKTDADVSNTEEFNTTVNTITAGAWASGGNLNTGRTGLAGAGSQTAALAFGGTVATPSTPQNPYKNESEEYNGTSWTEGNNLNQARSNIGGNGTQTAALGYGGLPGSGQSATANSEEYNGTSWSEGNNLNTASYTRVGAGPQTASIAMGGATYTTPPSSFAVNDFVEYYDGTSWSEQNDMNTARYIAAGCGTQTAGLVSGGNAPPGTTAIVEEWDGTSWSEVNDLPTAVQQHAMSGTQTAALQAGGSTGSVTTLALKYDGTNWSTAPIIATARSALAGGDIGATQTSSIVFGGAYYT